VGACRPSLFRRGGNYPKLGEKDICRKEMTALAIVHFSQFLRQ